MFRLDYHGASCDAIYLLKQGNALRYLVEEEDAPRHVRGVRSPVLSKEGPLEQYIYY